MERVSINSAEYTMSRSDDNEHINLYPGLCVNPLRRVARAILGDEEARHTYPIRVPRGEDTREYWRERSTELWYVHVVYRQ